MKTLWEKEQKIDTYTHNVLKSIQKLKLVFQRVENIAGKGENVGYQFFSPFPSMFLTGSVLGAFKRWNPVKPCILCI